MSRIYSDDPLTSLPVKNINLENEWDPSAFHRGEGVLLEGTIKNRSRFVLTDSGQNKHRYFLFVVQAIRGYKRVFDESGVEVEADLTASEKVRTGHLQSSYKVVPKTKLESSELASLTQTGDVLERFSTAKLEKDCLHLLIEEKILENSEISVDNRVRLKTKGFGPFVETILKIDSTTAAKSHFAGDEDIGSNWTSKIMSAKEHQVDKQQSADGKNDCVADEEWED